VCKEREREREAGGRGRECPRERGSAVGMCTRIWRRRREEKGKRGERKKVKTVEATVETDGFRLRHV
jgi:hypothetical protein